MIPVEIPLEMDENSKMRYYELITEAKPTKPLTPAKASERAKREQSARAALHDTQKMNAIRVQKAKRKIADI